MQKTVGLANLSLAFVIAFVLLPSCGRLGLKDSDAISSCIDITGPEIIGSVESDLIDEASGLISSRKNSGVKWTHNDSGDSARIFALNLNGDHLGVFNLLNAENNDWEDIAAGPGPVEGEQYLFAGDIGDNNRVRSSISVYRFQEPAVDRNQTADTFDISGVDKLEMQYPDNQAFDAETLLVDPISGDIFIITKNSGESSVFRNPSPHNPGELVLLEKVASISLGTSFFNAVTGGDISADGSMIILRSYANAVILARDVEANMSDAFSGVKCDARVNESLSEQGEAIAFDPDGDGYTTVIEGSNPSLKHYSIIN